MSRLDMKERTLNIILKVNYRKVDVPDKANWILCQNDDLTKCCRKKVSNVTDHFKLRKYVKKWLS